MLLYLLRHRLHRQAESAALWDEVKMEVESRPEEKGPRDLDPARLARLSARS